MILLNENIAKAFERMDLREVDADAHNDPKIREALIMQIRHFPAFALPDHHDPLVICGFVPEFGTVTAWMVTARGFKYSAHHVLPMQKGLCADMYVALGAHRMQIEVEADRADANKWAQALGFEYETNLKRGSATGTDLSIYLWPDLEREKP